MKNRRYFGNSNNITQEGQNETIEKKICPFGFKTLPFLSDVGKELAT